MKDTKKTTAGASQWRTIWLKAVVKSWSDKAFAQRLKKDARAALKELNYDLPKEIELTVVAVTSKDDGWLGETAGWKLPPIQTKTKITLPLPPAPADEADQAIAIASLLGLASSDACCGDPCCA
jgi:ribosomally synthesized peptide (two-chain TOMM family)